MSPSSLLPQQALNCIVDDSALTAGTRDNSIKQWINKGLINVFVPLYTLERLNALKLKGTPSSFEAAKVLEWLDHITTWTDNKESGRVQLQGPDDQYQSWKEVESYLLPETPFSISQRSDSVDTLSKTLEENLSVGNTSSPSGNDGSTALSDSFESTTDLSTTPESAEAGLSGTSDIQVKHSGPQKTTPPSRMSKRNMINSTHRPAHVVPARIRPLLNFVVWRTHYQGSSDSNIYILLTNSPDIQEQAKKFGVRAKLLSDVKKIVSRDESLTNTADLSNKAADSHVPPQQEFKGDNVDEDDEEIVFNGTRRPVSANGPLTRPDLIDPDHFGRSPHHSPQSSTNVKPRGGYHPTRAGRISTRGRFQSPGRGGLTTHVQVPTGPSAGRGGAQMRGRAFNDGRHQRVFHQRPIDPDSYARPPPTLHRGRGTIRKIWEPS